MGCLLPLRIMQPNSLLVIYSTFQLAETIMLTETTRTIRMSRDISRSTTEAISWAATESFPYERPEHGLVVISRFQRLDRREIKLRTDSLILAMQTRILR